MTDRLYYTDPYSGEFDATVVSIEPRDGRAVVRLDRSCFYPTGGGQPSDTGSLGGCQVVDVYEDEDNGVAHVVEKGDALHVGDRVHGVIDWRRRFDHMQQHTGQHVLSAAFDRLFGVRTLSFHLGAEASTIDLARQMTPSELGAAEDEANRIVWEDRPVTSRFVASAEAARLPLRKRLRPARDVSPREVERERAGVGPREPKEGRPRAAGTLRLIEVEEFDLSACGGTHVARTGAIGIIAIGAWERFKTGQRVEFLCGGRALGRFRALRAGTTAAMRLLSASVGDLPLAIERLQGEARDQRRTMSALHTEVARHRAEALAAAAEVTSRGRLVLGAVDADAGALKTMASAVVARPGFVAVLVSIQTPSLMVVARSPDVDLSSEKVLGALIAKFGGRGGGKADLAQGGGLVATVEAILDEARAILR